MHLNMAIVCLLLFLFSKLTLFSSFIHWLHDTLYDGFSNPDPSSWSLCPSSNVLSEKWCLKYKKTARGSFRAMSRTMVSDRTAQGCWSSPVYEQIWFLFSASRQQSLEQCISGCQFPVSKVITYKLLLSPAGGQSGSACHHTHLLFLSTIPSLPSAPC